MSVYLYVYVCACVECSYADQRWRSEVTVECVPLLISTSSCETVLVWIKMLPHRLQVSQYLNKLSPVGGTFMGGLGHVAFLEEACY